MINSITFIDAAFPCGRDQTCALVLPAGHIPAVSLILRYRNMPATANHCLSRIIFENMPSP
ncbi:hypothetical protein HMPREF1548_02107 [Clostridium sp. KLE 1755]|nr:hypothetical protein HMPREF1548_02107 [Clostridium sp. KLE 1755]